MNLKSFSHDELIDLLDYDPVSGIFYWKKSRSKLAKKGFAAGAINLGGYIGIQIFGKKYLAHRLAWFYLYKAWPEKHIDHINGIKTDNRIGNLRQVSRFENLQNQKMQKRNTSGFRGVSFVPKRKKWQASIGVNGKLKYLGVFLNKEDAYTAYLKAASIYHTHNPLVNYEKEGI